MIARALSLAIAICYTVAAIIGGGIFGLFVMIFLLLPLGLIWFPDAWGNVTGVVRGSRITQESPPILVSLMGWFLRGDKDTM
jgi:hypothetical protein